MAGISDKELALAKVYSSAMIELAARTGDTQVLGQELADLAAYLDRDEAFDRFLSSPTVDTDARKAAIEKLFRGRYSDLCVDALQVMNRKERLGLLRAVAKTYHELDEERRGRVEVLVRSAVALTDENRARLTEAAKTLTGREVDLIEHVDESLLAGMVVRIGDRQYDMSAASRLQRIRKSLVQRAAQEAHGGRSFVEGSAA
jgi:F-type H+-transporting ATPase subunit delta